MWTAGPYEQLLLSLLLSQIEMRVPLKYEALQQCHPDVAIWQHALSCHRRTTVLTKCRTHSSPPSANLEERRKKAFDRILGLRFLLLWFD